VDFGAFLPFRFIDIAGTVLGIAVVFGIGMNGWRMWKMIGSGPEDPPKWTIAQRASNLANLFIREVVFQRTLRKCNTGRLQWTAHLSLIMGFAGAAITTTLVFVLSPGGKPFPLDNPVKILGNASAALLLFGGTIMIARRILRKNTVGRTHFQDALFITLLYVVAITGTLSEIGRLLNTSTLAFPSYAIHLTSVVLLLGLAPYTKFAHSIYRPLAMYIAKNRGWPD
jgi:uncharacterized membrane protein SirB2